MPANLENSPVVTGLEKVTAMPTNVQTTSQLHSFHMLARSCSKFFKLSFNSTWTENFADVQAGFRKGRGTRDHTANICLIIKKGREFQKNTYFCSMDYAKACVDHNKLWKILKEMGIPDHLTCLMRNLSRRQMKVKKQQLEVDMEQQTDSKSGKEYVKAVHCHPAYLTYMQTTSYKMLL